MRFFILLSLNRRFELVRLYLVIGDFHGFCMIMGYLKDVLAMHRT